LILFKLYKLGQNNFDFWKKRFVQIFVKDI
jgi:hypothetical protein